MNALSRPVAIDHELRSTLGDAGSMPRGSAGAKARMIERDEILMIEACTTDADLVRTAFKIAGIANPLLVIPNSEEGLDYLFAAGTCASDTPGRPKIILLDLNLPGMSGLEFLRCAKEDAHTRDIPVVVLSQSETDRNIMTCMRLGAAGYIVKPLTIETLTRVSAKLNLSLTIGLG